MAGVKCCLSEVMFFFKVAKKNILHINVKRSHAVEAWENANHTWFLMRTFATTHVPFNPFPYTTNLQQTTLKVWRQKHKKSSLNVGIITEESWKHCCKSRNCSYWAISTFVKTFSKVVCCSGVRKRLYERKG